MNVSFENHADADKEENGQDGAGGGRPGMFRRFVSGVGSVLSSIFWCDDNEEEEL